jgi:putative ABC transport system ATP-binding protein
VSTEPTNEPLIVLNKVSKDYVSGAGVVRALRDVSLTIERGEFVAIVGTSGSGKSTLMNNLGCLDRPTRGTYRLAELDVGDRTNDGRALVRNRLIGFIFQGFNLLPRTTALENCELPLQYRGVGGAERRRRAIASLEAVGLADRVHHTPNQLSGGQQQRVAIARALVSDPPLLLADEPTGNLDTRTSYEVLALLQRLNRELKITVCIVTHEHDIAACASRVIHVKDGKIQSDTIQGDPRDAARALAELPPPAELDAAPVSQREDHGDVLEALRRRLGGPVPLKIYALALLGFAVGGVVGTLYDALVLGERGPIIPAVAAVLTETWLVSRTSKTHFGRPMTNDQRARFSLAYSVAFAALVSGVGAWLYLPKAPSWVTDRVDALASPGVAVALLLVGLLIATTALLRFLLLSFFSPEGSFPAWRPSISAPPPPEE